MIGFFFFVLKQKNAKRIINSIETVPPTVKSLKQLATYRSAGFLHTFRW